MPHVVIAGASGVVGSRVLHHLLERDEVDRVVAVGRRRLPLQHVRLTSVVCHVACHGKCDRRLYTDIDTGYHHSTPVLRRQRGSDLDDRGSLLYDDHVFKDI
jgi:nucleoside-diphosphate-sugar epimerase